MKSMPVTALSDTYLDSVAKRLAQSAHATAGGCWEWTGVRDRHGYGRIKVVVGGIKRETGAHRASWIVHRGPIPSPELQTDHLCRNRACINPDHMELVTNRVNTLRSIRDNPTAQRGRPRGVSGCGKHGMSDGYSATCRDGYIRWVCRVCRRAASARYKARNRQA